MTTSTTTFQIYYPVTTYEIVEVERPSDISRDELLASVSREDLEDSIHENGGCAWDSLKDAWVANDVYIILDLAGKEVLSK